MPWQSPTLEEIASRIRADQRALLPDARPELRRSLLGVLAKQEAGTAQGLYGYLDWQARQIIPDTADEEILLRWADVWGIAREDARRATGTIELTGDADAELLEGTTFEADSGETYTTDETVTLDSNGEGTVAVTAEDAGDAGNLDTGETLRLVSAVSGIDGEATVDPDGISGGAEQESISRVRERLLNRIQRPPHGGAKDDYQAWALEAHPDVTRVWPVPNATGLGTVTVRFMTDEATSDGVPEQAVIDTVQDYIDEQRPVTADVSVVAPVAVPLDLTISITPDTTEVRERIQDALEDYLEREAEPGGTLYVSQINGVIYVASGDSRHDLSSPTADQTYAANEIAVLGTITWA